MNKFKVKKKESNLIILAYKKALEIIFQLAIQKNLQHQ